MASVRARVAQQWRRLPHPIRWVGVAAVGFTLIVVGLVFMVLPGPGIPLVILGFAILATEFAWAEFVLARFRHAGRVGMHRAKQLLTRTRSDDTS